MGLDMYLTANKYLSTWDEAGEDYTKSEAIKALFPEIPLGRVKDVNIELMYWRKANAIHNWFVQNVQDGVDECQESYVDREKLVALLATCHEVLRYEKKKNKAKILDLLPPTSGFFFGSTDIDDWFFESIRDTAEALEKILKMDLKGWSIHYHSSW